MTISTRDEIAKLTAPERLTLIGDLWDSLTDSDVPVPHAQARELAHRLDSFASDTPQAVTWTQLKAELVARVPPFPRARWRCDTRSCQTTLSLNVCGTGAVERNDGRSSRRSTNCDSSG